MDKIIIRNYNELVAPEDDVYITGDFSIKTQQHKGYLEGICRKLNGRKHLIGGNHDVDRFLFYAGDRGIGFFAFHYPIHIVDEFVLCHDPSLSQADRTRPFIGGHIHDLFLKQKNFLNVGVDMWDFKPVSIDQVRECFKDDLDENGRMKKV
jgi:calcineurin-like phosphoesterase family protein